MPSNVRVRFAPSPTGNPHIGNVRTAIFAWLFARRHDGAFMIRVEDTDQSRRTEGAVEAMLESLRWVGLDWDEGPDVGGDAGPYTQSERLPLYRAAAERLIASGDAYRCYCSAERLDRVRLERQQAGADLIGYDRHCLSLSDDERARLEADGAPSVVRFKMPDDGVSALDDIVFGRLEFENRLYDDFIALKSDGFPTYHLASVVDDHHMRISHVMRAKEWISSVPRHVQLYKALGWDMPKFAHLPVILAPDRTKLSKRHGAASVMDYRDMGVLPEALLNYLTLLGWSLDGSTEFFTPDDLIAAFDISRISRSDAMFDFDKLIWLNGQHIRARSDARLDIALARFWAESPPDFTDAAKVVPMAHEHFRVLDDAAKVVPMAHEHFRVLDDAAKVVPMAHEYFKVLDDAAKVGSMAQEFRKALDDAAKVGSMAQEFRKALDDAAKVVPMVHEYHKALSDAAKVAPLVRERLKTLADAAPLVKFAFAEKVSPDRDQLIQRRMDAESTRAALTAAHGALSDVEPFDASTIESTLRQLADELGIRVGPLLGSLRVATTAQRVSPPIFESLEVLGRKRTLERIANAIELL